MKYKTKEKRENVTPTNIYVRSFKSDSSENIQNTLKLQIQIRIQKKNTFKV